MACVENVGARIQKWNFNSCRLLHFSTKWTWSIHFPITFKSFLISLCYVECQNILVNVLVHLLEHLRFRLRCPNFLLSKFALQLKLIQSVVRVGILGICVKSSILRVLLSRFWVSGSQFPSPRDPFPGSRSPRVLGSESQGTGSQGPGSQVLILDYAALL